MTARGLLITQTQGIALLRRGQSWALDGYLTTIQDPRLSSTSNLQHHARPVIGALRTCLLTAA